MIDWETETPSCGSSTRRVSFGLDREVIFVIRLCVCDEKLVMVVQVKEAKAN